MLVVVQASDVGVRVCNQGGDHGGGGGGGGGGDAADDHAPSSPPAPLIGAATRRIRQWKSSAGGDQNEIMSDESLKRVATEQLALERMNRVLVKAAAVLVLVTLASLFVTFGLVIAGGELVKETKVTDGNVLVSSSSSLNESSSPVKVALASRSLSLSSLPFLDFKSIAKLSQISFTLDDERGVKMSMKVARSVYEEPILAGGNAGIRLYSPDGAMLHFDRVTGRVYFYEDSNVDTKRVEVKLNGGIDSVNVDGRKRGSFGYQCSCGGTDDCCASFDHFISVAAAVRDSCILGFGSITLGSMFGTGGLPVYYDDECLLNERIGPGLGITFERKRNPAVGVASYWTGSEQVTETRVDEVAGTSTSRSFSRTTVTEVSAVNCGASGQFHYALGYLSRLDSLNMEGNAISGSLPTLTFYSTNAVTINLANNLLSGTLPVFQVPNNDFKLNSLDLSNNSFSGFLYNKFEGRFMYQPGGNPVINLKSNRFKGNPYQYLKWNYDDTNQVGVSYNPTKFYLQNNCLTKSDLTWITTKAERDALVAGLEPYASYALIYDNDSVNWPFSAYAGIGSPSDC